MAQPRQGPLVGTVTGPPFRSAEQRERDGEAERLGGLEVENQFEFCGLLNGQVGRLLALENAADVDSNSLKRATRATTAQKARAGLEGS
jgi:hypothetical protein